MQYDCIGLARTFELLSKTGNPMDFNKKMPKSLLRFYKSELQQAKIELEKLHYSQSWRHLERAHILGQPFAFQHTFVHWKMLNFAFRIKSIKEILGQLPRLFFGGIKSFVGKIPVGNTGGANVPPLRTMAIPDDLVLIIQKHKD